MHGSFWLLHLYLREGTHLLHLLLIIIHCYTVRPVARCTLVYIWGSPRHHAVSDWVSSQSVKFHIFSCHAFYSRISYGHVVGMVRCGLDVYSWVYNNRCYQLMLTNNHIIHQTYYIIVLISVITFLYVKINDDGIYVHNSHNTLCSIGSTSYIHYCLYYELPDMRLIER